MNVYITTILAVASPSIANEYYRSKKKKKRKGKMHQKIHTF